MTDKPEVTRLRKECRAHHKSAIELTGANCHDSTQALPLLDAIPPLQGLRGRPRCRPDCVLGDSTWAGWISSAAQGDQLALARLYDSTSRIVYGLILRIVSDAATAEDVLLDTYVQVWRQAGGFDPARGTPLGWLLMIARSRALDALRSRAVRETKQQESLEEVSAIVDPAPLKLDVNRPQSAAAVREISAVQLVTGSVSPSTTKSATKRIGSLERPRAG